MERSVFPFSAIVGQEKMKLALILNAINPAIGGVLIRGEKGTGKSTAVRALARLLPELTVVADCPYRCDPQERSGWCEGCQERGRRGEGLPRAQRQMRVVELPINASEDRVVGAIDLEAALKEGERRFEPGVLAEANRNLLYVDEVNLLDDHIVDVLLDAAAMGVNVVEREGISVWHPSRFILVGTMNPEEGELRPQLLDRFGLCVDVHGEEGIGARVEIMEAEADFATRSGPMMRRYGAAERQLARGIEHAGRILPHIALRPALNRLISALCLEANVLGHRADIVVARAAGAAAAYRGKTEVGLEDVLSALELALAHRRREARGKHGQPFDMQELATQARQQLSQLEAQASATPTEVAQEAASGTQSASGAEQGEGHSMARQGSAQPSEGPGPESDAVVELKTFPVRQIELPRDRRLRRTAGKRTTARSPRKRGRYIRSTQVEKTTDLALDATIRAAAPHQRRRRAGRPVDGFLLERQDLRQKVRDRKMGNLIVFVVDASASMDAEQRMVATKGAVLSLLRDAYVRRDKVALVIFSGRVARVVLRPTASTDLAQRRLERLAVGGTTPLTHGLMAGLKVIQTERRRDQSIYPLLVLISDGRGNISMWGEEPLVEAQQAAAMIRTEQVRSVVIDSARDYTHALYGVRTARPAANAYGTYAFNVCQDLAQRMAGRYYGLYDLSQQAIVSTVRAEMEAQPSG